MAAKNNLTFTELLHPFSKLRTDVTLKDADGTNHNIPQINVILQDFKKESRKSLNQKLVLDRVDTENCTEDEMVTKYYDKISLDAPGYTPWFDVWMKLYLQGLPVMDNEFLKHELGCIFVASTKCNDPVEQLRKMTQIHQNNLNYKSGTGIPHFGGTEAVKYYVLVHDIRSDVAEEKMEDIFKQVLFCHSISCIIDIVDKIELKTISYTFRGV